MCSSTHDETALHHPDAYDMQHSMHTFSSRTGPELQQPAQQAGMQPLQIAARKEDMLKTSYGTSAQAAAQQELAAGNHPDIKGLEAGAHTQAVRYVCCCVMYCLAAAHQFYARVPC
jgi:hypothetical protein